MPSTLYERDFFAWTADTATKIREQRFKDIELAALAEEIEDLGKSTRRALESRTSVLMAHLLKWDMQSEQRGTSWQATIREQQRKVRKLLVENLSLAKWLADNLDDIYVSAVLHVVSETGLPEPTFPSACPFTIEEALHRELEFK